MELMQGLYLSSKLELVVTSKASNVHFVYRDKEVGSVVSRNEYMAGSLLSAISKAGRYDQGG